MANSNGIITAPIGLTSDVKSVLGATSNDLGTLCTSNLVNIGSIVKPMEKNNLYVETINNSNPTDHYILGTKADGYSTDYRRNVFGIYMPYVCNQETWNSISLQLGAIRSFYLDSAQIGNINTIANKLWKWAKPETYYRLTDFNHYDHRECSNYYCTWSIDDQNIDYNYRLLQICSQYSTLSGVIGSNLLQDFNVFNPSTKFSNEITCSVKTKVNTNGTPKYVSFNDYIRMLFDVDSDSNNNSNIYNFVMFSGFLQGLEDWKDGIPAYTFDSYNTKTNSTSHQCNFTYNVGSISGKAKILMLTVGIGQCVYDGIYTVPKRFIIPKDGFRLLNLVYRHSLGNVGSMWNGTSTAPYTQGNTFFNVQINFDYSFRNQETGIYGDHFFGIPHVKWNDNSINYSTNLQTYNILILYAGFYNSSENKTYMVKMRIGATDHSEYNIQSSVNKTDWFGRSPMSGDYDYYYTDSTHTFSPWNIGAQSAPGYVFNASLNNKTFSMYFVCDDSGIVPNNSTLIGIFSSYYNYKTHRTITGQFNHTSTQEFVQMN